MFTYSVLKISRRKYSNNKVCHLLWKILIVQESRMMFTFYLIEIHILHPVEYIEWGVEGD